MPVLPVCAGIISRQARAREAARRALTISLYSLLLPASFRPFNFAHFLLTAPCSLAARFVSMLRRVSRL